MGDEFQEYKFSIDKERVPAYQKKAMERVAL